MDSIPIFIVILLALLIGWLLGRRQRPSKDRSEAPQQLSKDYFEGLNYLLNEQPDQAVETFIRALEVNSETMETHLALGNLLRRRGEVDKAIRIHQNLLARPVLNRSEQLLVQLELAQDYLQAGLLDRAERLLQEIVDKGGRYKNKAREYLVELYQQEKEWQQAINAAKPLAQRRGDKMYRSLSHFYCELAAFALAQQDYRLARSHLKDANNYDADCVRVSLLQGQLEAALGRYKDATKALKRIRLQNPKYVSESLQPLAECYRALDNEKELQKYLLRCLEEHPSIAIVLSLAAMMRSSKGEEAAADFIGRELIKRPTLKGVNQLLDIHIERSGGRARENLEILRLLTEQLLSARPVYRCGECGFGAKSLYWLCPGCRSWGGIAPIQGVEGD